MVSRSKNIKISEEGCGDDAEMTVAVEINVDGYGSDSSSLSAGSFGGQGAPNI